MKVIVAEITPFVDVEERIDVENVVNDDDNDDDDVDDDIFNESSLLNKKLIVFENC